MAETCNLLVIRNVKDPDGFPSERVTRYEDVYVLKEKSVRATEFYEAKALDLSPRLQLELRQEEWERTEHIVDGIKEYASKVEYDGGTYDVVRYYKRNKSTIEIILSAGKREYMR